MKKVLFIAPSHMSTTKLVERTIDIAKESGVEIYIEIADEAEGLRRIASEPFDVLLINPMLRYLLNNKKENAAIPRRMPTVVVDSVIYGKLDGRALFNLIVYGREMYQRPTLPYGHGS